MKILIVAFFSLITNFCIAQNIYKNQKIGFEIEQPENWIVAKDGQTLENLKEQIKLDSKTLNKLIEDSKGTIQIVSFYKYPIESTQGVIPTIKINLRKNSTKSFEEFKKGITESFKSIKDIFPDFKFLTTPSKVTINGFDCVKSTSSYTLKGHSGKEKVTITIYAIPVKDKFYQITFMDSEYEDNSKLYEKIIKTISIY